MAKRGTRHLTGLIILNPRRRNNRGFTLIEIIAVLVVLGVLAAVVTSRSFDTSADLIGQIEVVKGHLRYAQMKAMNDEVPWGIDFSGGASYTLQKDGVDSPIPLPGSDSPTHTLASGSASASSNPVVFNEWGDPGAAVTVTVSDGGDSQSFTITSTTGFIP